MADEPHEDAKGEGAASDEDRGDALDADADAPENSDAPDAGESERSDDAADAEPEKSAASGEEDSAPAESAPHAQAGQSAQSDGPGSRRGGSRWWAILGAVLLVELFVYGRRAEVDVCAGKKGSHDFELVGQERTDANRWKFPRCETRLNLGLRSRYDEAVEEAAKVACRGATVFRHKGEGKQCLEATDGWEHRVETHYIWPWDERFYRHLFWFLDR